MSASILSIVSTESYFKEIINIFNNEAKGKKVIYVTLLHDSNTLIEKFKLLGIDNKDILFIDGVAKRVCSNSGNCIFLQQSSLSDLGIAITESIKSISDDKLVIFDSVSSLLPIYNAKAIAKFELFLINQMKIQNIPLIQIAWNSDINKDILMNIQSFVEEVRFID